ncbi:unnamed protein product [Cochlearia groenlandica]
MNQQLGLNVITELIIGLLIPGKAASQCRFQDLRIHKYVSSLVLLSETSSSCHYMNIPTRSIFLAMPLSQGYV